MYGYGDEEGEDLGDFLLEGLEERWGHLFFCVRRRVHEGLHERKARRGVLEGGCLGYFVDYTLLMVGVLGVKEQTVDCEEERGSLGKVLRGGVGVRVREWRRERLRIGRGRYRQRGGWVRRLLLE